MPPEAQEKHTRLGFEPTLFEDIELSYRPKTEFSGGDRRKFANISVSKRKRIDFNGKICKNSGYWISVYLVVSNS